MTNDEMNLYDLRYPQNATDTRIDNLRLVHDAARVEFPKLNVIASRPADRSTHRLLFGPKGDKGLDLRESPCEFTAIFDNTGMKYVPVELEDRVYFNLLYTRDGVPFRTMFQAEVADISGSFWGKDDPNDVEDGSVSVTFKVTYLCGRAPDSDYGSGSFAKLDRGVFIRWDVKYDLQNIADQLDAQTENISELVRKLRNHLDLRSGRSVD